MIEFKEKVFDYLQEEGHPERKKALKILLTKTYFFDYDDGESQAKETIRFWLNKWERNSTFCAEGINRARQALLPEDVKPKLHKYQVTVEVECEFEFDYNPSGLDFWGYVDEAIRNNIVFAPNHKPKSVRSFGFKKIS